MNTLYRKTDVLFPSTASFLLVLGVIAVVLASLILSRSGQEQLVVLLLGTDASVTLTQATGLGLSEGVSAVFGNDILGRTVVFVVWAFVGLLAFTLMNAIIGISGGINEAKVAMRSSDRNKRLFEYTLAQQVAWRLAIAVAWTGYTLVFLKFLLPFSVSAAYIALSYTALNSDRLLAVAALSLLGLGVHGHVVLARLFAARVRLWDM